ncbi:DedA family protein [Yinghuangia sp. ASG 101]|uniref:DedA family protein n=1 Tax=Yinghuangia sp. ASG 101 TaxID=2896848 RepID=UPI001E4F2E6B|nr:DedA family protein [Yinghuangia sp. ASG 101]UGQ11700.1 DedA family protein [Yinghuangia sp. ASG 101]
MHSIIDWLRGLSGPLVYAVVGGLVFAEDALFVGFVLPGETAAVVGGAIASGGRDVSLLPMIAVVVVAAIAGDSVGYAVGHRAGPRLLATRMARRHSVRIERAQDVIRRRGPYAVFLGRFVAVLRALVPTLSGVAKMPYRRFLLFNALGGVLWGAGFVLLGWGAGAAYDRIARQVGEVAAGVVAAVAVAAVAVWAWRRHRRDE